MSFTGSIKLSRLTCALAVAPLLAMAGCAGSEKTETGTIVHNVFVVNPLPAGAEGSVSLPATVEEGRTISVGFKTAGQIKRILVKEGSHVSAGQLVAVLDTVDYALGVSTLREKYAQLLSETERHTKLHASGNMSDNDYEKATSGLRQLALQLKVEENRLSYCRLTSPASGIVTKVNFENSEMVDAGTPVIELMDNSSLEAVVDLPVRLYAARDRFESFIGISSLDPSRQVRLQMLSLTPRADNSQLYRLRLGVPAGSGFTSGMNITVRINSLTSGNRSVTVPLSSVFDKSGHQYVWVVNPADSVVRAAEVKVSGTGEGGVVDIVSGITDQDIIVRAGVHHLVDGEKVNILPGESETNPGNIL